MTACACCRRYEVDYGDRAEHCWNGDHDNGNGISRLRYNTMYLERCAPPSQLSPVPAYDVCHVEEC